MKEGVLALVADLNKHYDRQVIMPASQYPKEFRIPIGSPVVDYIMGGGYPVGRAVEFYGGESSTKTYHAQMAIARFQKFDWGNQELDGIEVMSYKETKVRTKLKSGEFVETKMYTPDKVNAKKGYKIKYVALVDVEGSYIPEWGEYMGIDNKLLIRVIPSTGEQAIDVAESLLRNPEISLVVFDSVMVTRASGEIEKSMEDGTMGKQATMWGRGSAKFQSAMNENLGVSMILINRAYEKIGLVFGDPEVIGGGRALRHFKAISMKFVALKTDTGTVGDQEGVVLGRNIKVENKKNKTSRPLKSGLLYFCLADDPATDLKYGETDIANDMTELGVQLGVVQKKGNVYSYGRLRINGREKFVDELRRKKALLNTLVNEVIIK
jgi:recombination protein RecA